MAKDNVDMPDVAKAFSKRKQNISDEERQRRRERMLELRKKLGQVSKAKPAKKEATPLPIEKEEESDSSSSEDEAPTQPAKQAKPKPAKSKPKSKHVKKVVKIKYYGDISKDEMDYDTKLLANIHSNDNEYEDRKLSRKEERKKLKEKQKPATELYEPPEDIEPEPVVDPEKEKLDRAIKSLWG